MSQQTINVGTSPNDGTGTPLRTAFQYTNSNFSELYTAVGPSGNNIVVPGSATITGNLTVDTNTLFVDSTNNRVGVGTASPTQDIDVNGVALATNFYLRSDDSDVSWGAGIGSRPIIRGNKTNNTLKFYTASTERATLDSSGNLGLGVTPSAWGAGIKAFQMLGAGSAFYATAGSQTLIGVNAYYDTSWKYGSTNFATYYEQTSGQHKWYTAPSGTAGTAITFTQAMTLDASGNLIIGAASGSSAVDITRTGSISSEIALKQTGASGRQFNLSSTGSGYGSAGNFIIYDVTGGAERMRVDASGNFIAYAQATPPTLGTNSQMVFNLTSNTNLRISVRGTDGTTRTANITLA